MRKILYAGIILLTITSGYGMGIAMMGDKMSGGHGKQHDKKQDATKSGQGETDSQKITDNKSDSDGLIGCHSGTTQDNQKKDDKPADMTNRK
ncbi:MAG TPA: hypothetical protein DD713_04295 [Nitrospiraceae bacterium]|nr:hypothetical protein [Nitrospiraceae bacterium]